MRNTRWIILAWILLVTVAFGSWELYAFLSREPERTVDASGQSGAGKEGEAKADPDIYGLVKSVDATHSTITLSAESEDGKAQEQTYDLAKDVHVLMDDTATLADLTADTRVALEFWPGRKVVTAIRSEPFRIVAKPKQEEIEAGKPFDVVLRVVNASPSLQSFWVMFGSWDIHWRSSNPRVAWDIRPCYLNGPITVKIAPGEAYEKTLPMRVIGTGRVAFMMSFTPLAGNTMFAASKRTYWSQEVILNVK